MIRIICLIVLVMSSMLSVSAADIKVFCAASLVDVMSELRDNYRSNHDEEVKLNFASSGILARQIEQGASADIYISASQKWVYYLENENLIEKKVGIVSNSLVLIAGNDVIDVDISQDIDSLLDKRLSIADPAHVPAGMYAKEVLVQIGQWDKLKKICVLGRDVRSALQPVVLGEIGYGIVYKTDALKAKNIRIITTFPSDLHSPIIYSMAQVKDGAGEDFFDYLLSDKAMVIWQEFGFTVM